MGFLKKLAFWKKDDLTLNDFHNSNLGINDSLGLDSSRASNSLGLGLNSQSTNTQNFGSEFQAMQGSDNSFGQFDNSYNGFAQNPLKGIDMSKAKIIEKPDTTSQTHDLDYMHEKNMEIISSKLDAIKSALEAINQRLINIERLANTERQKPLW